jgi:hypothetical protein
MQHKLFCRYRLSKREPSALAEFREEGLMKRFVLLTLVVAALGALYLASSATARLDPGGGPGLKAGSAGQTPAAVRTTSTPADPQAQGEDNQREDTTADDETGDDCSPTAGDEAEDCTTAVDDETGDDCTATAGDEADDNCTAATADDQGDDAQGDNNNQREDDQGDDGGSDG